MSVQESEFLQLSGIQHFSFCRRQWALIHIEQQWKENLYTIQGQILHERAHDETVRAHSRDKIIIRGLKISSSALGISGACDVVEFIRSKSGARLFGEEGFWIPYPIEYKRGASKVCNADRLQLCAQAMCLEEMLSCSVTEGALFYGETRRRERVSFDEVLREQVRQMFEEMHNYFSRGYTPKVKTGKHCNACSLKELCLPILNKTQSARDYIQKHIREEEI